MIKEKMKRYSFLLFFLFFFTVCLGNVSPQAYAMWIEDFIAAEARKDFDRAMHDQILLEGAYNYLRDGDNRVVLEQYLLNKNLLFGQKNLVTFLNILPERLLKIWHNAVLMSMNMRDLPKKGMEISNEKYNEAIKVIEDEITGGANKNKMGRFYKVLVDLAQARRSLDKAHKAFDEAGYLIKRLDKDTDKEEYFNSLAVAIRDAESTLKDLLQQK